MSPAAWQRKLARRWRMVGIVAAVAYIALKVAGFDILAFLAAGATALAFARAFDGLGWSEGWDARGGLAAEQIRERVVSEAVVGAPAGMLAVYASVEAEHVIAGHDGDSGSCGSCNLSGTAWVRARRAELAEQR